MGKRLFGTILVLLLFVSMAFALTVGYTKDGWYSDDLTNERGADVLIFSNNQYANCDPTGNCAIDVKIKNVSAITQNFSLDSMFPKDKKVIVNSINEVTNTFVDVACNTQSIRCSEIKTSFVEVDKNKLNVWKYVCLDDGSIVDNNKEAYYSTSQICKSTKTTLTPVKGVTSKMSDFYNESYYDKTRFSISSRVSDYASVGILKDSEKVLRYNFVVPKSSSGEFLFSTDKPGSVLDPYWDTSWSYRKPITINVPADQNLYKYSKLRINLDSNDLIVANKLQADCDDFRVIYQDTQSMDLNVAGCGTTDTNIFFNYSMGRLSASASDTNFYLYYGNAAASKYSSNDINVETFFDNFDDGSVSDWNAAGTWTVQNGILTSGNASGKIITYTDREFEIPKDGVRLFASYDTNKVGGPKTGGSNGQLLGFTDHPNPTGACGTDNFTDYALASRGGINSAKWILFNRTGYRGTWTAISPLVNVSNRATAGTWVLDLTNNTKFTADTTSLDIFNTNEFIYSDKSRGTSNWLDNNFVHIFAESADCEVLYWNRVYVTYIHKTTTSLGAQETPPQIYRIYFDVNRTGTATALNGVTADWNVNDYDVSGQNSPFTQDVSAGSYLVTFSRTGYDSNSNFVVNADVNKTYTIYLADSTPPSVGTTTLSGFSTYSTYIKGTGDIIGGAATDSGSGIDDTSCEYTANNGGAWASGTWNSNHCEKTSYAISNGTTYQFNTRVKDVAANQGTGTATTSYTGDTAGPAISYTIINAGTNLDGINYDLNTIATDAGSGTASVSYKCYSGTGDGSGCTATSWDCHTGNLAHSTGNNWGTVVAGSIKDTSGTWTCKVTATDNLSNVSTDTNTATMNELTGIVVDAASGTYAGDPNSSNNPIFTDQSKAYLVITHNGNVNLTITGTGNNFTYAGNTILLANQKWYLTDNAGSSTPFTGAADAMKTSWTKGTYPTSATQNIYLWLNIPINKPSGAYASILTIGSGKT